MPKINYASMFTLRKDGRYQVKYTDDAGKHTLYDKDPEKLYYKLQEAKKGAVIKPTTFKDVADSWEREHREKIEDRTWRNYAPHLKDMVSQYGETPIEEMEPVDIINDLARAKTKGWSATVVNTRKSIFRMVFDHAIVIGKLKYNPAVSVRLPKGLKRGKRTAPTQEQMELILNNVHAPFGLFPFLLLCTGMRKSEALALTWDDIDLKNKTISVTKSVDYTVDSKPVYKPPKTAAGYRTIPIISPLLTELERAAKERKNGPLFPQPDSSRGGPGGGIMSQKAYDTAWDKYCKSTGLEGITAHNLRHGAATLMFEFGVDEMTTQKVLGHSNIQITREIYTDLRESQLSKSADKFDAGVSDMVSNSRKPHKQGT